MTELHVRTVLEPRGPAAAIVLSDDEVVSLDAGKAFPVVVDFGDRSIRLRLARMGGENLIGFSKAARTEVGVTPGDRTSRRGELRQNRWPCPVGELEPVFCGPLDGSHRLHGCVRRQRR